MQMGSAIPYSLKVYVLGTSPTVRMVGRTYVLKTGEEVRNLWFLGFSFESTNSHVLSITAANMGMGSVSSASHKKGRVETLVSLVSC